MSSVLIAILLVLVLPGAARAEDEPPKLTSHTERKLEGWTVRVDDRLLKAPDDVLGTKSLRFLENKLADIKVVVPEDKLKRCCSMPPR